MPIVFTAIFSNDHLATFTRETNIVIANSEAKPKGQQECEELDDCGEETEEVMSMMPFQYYLFLLKKNYIRYNICWSK